jgi:hypothetical protein
MDPAGNVHCSIADWAKFATLTLRGARGDTGLLISPESFRVIQTDMARRNRDPMGWELGARTWAGGAVLIHQEQGAWYAIIYVAPKADAAYLVTANRGDKDAELAAEEVLNAMVSQDLANAE